MKRHLRIRAVELRLGPVSFLLLGFFLRFPFCCGDLFGRFFLPDRIRW